MSAILTHIVPALPPRIDGVGDYALNLARHLRESHGVRSRFIVCDPDWEGSGRIDEFPVRRLRLRDEAGLWMLLSTLKEASTTFLHYVSYGYQKRGVPVWLYRGVRSWLTEPTATGRGRKQLCTVFHELWATGKPWRSAFYLSPLQQWLARGFHHWSTTSITSTLRMKEQLDAIQPGKTVLLPIPSNVPPAPLRSRTGLPAGPPRLRIAIFGQAWTRLSAIQSHTLLLRTLDAAGRLDSVMVLGKGASKTSADIVALRRAVAWDRIRIVGELSAADIGQCLVSADLFLSNYHGEWACKSGSLMAAIAAGCPAVLRDGRNAEPLRAGVHFLVSDDSVESVQRVVEMTASHELETIAERAREWYHRNAAWPVIARRYHEIHSPVRPVPAPIYTALPSQAELIPASALASSSSR